MQQPRRGRSPGASPTMSPVVSRSRSPSPARAPSPTNEISLSFLEQAAYEIAFFAEDPLAHLRAARGRPDDAVGQAERGQAAVEAGSCGGDPGEDVDGCGDGGLGAGVGVSVASGLVEVNKAVFESTAQRAGAYQGEVLRGYLLIRPMPSCVEQRFAQRFFANVEVSVSLNPFVPSASAVGRELCGEAVPGGDGEYAEAAEMQRVAPCAALPPVGACAELFSSDLLCVVDDVWVYELALPVNVTVLPRLPSSLAVKVQVMPPLSVDEPEELGRVLRHPGSDPPRAAVSATRVMRVTHPLEVTYAAQRVGGCQVLRVRMENVSDTDSVRVTDHRAAVASHEDTFDVRVDGIAAPVVLLPGEVLSCVLSHSPRSLFDTLEGGMYTTRLVLMWQPLSEAGRAIVEAPIATTYTMPWMLPPVSQVLVRTSFPPSIQVGEVFPVHMVVTNASDVARRLTLLVPAETSDRVAKVLANLAPHSDGLRRALLEHFRTTNLSSAPRDTAADATDAGHGGAGVGPPQGEQADEHASDQVDASVTPTNWHDNLSASLLPLVEQHGLAFPPNAALVCLEKSVQLGVLSAHASVSVNVHFLALCHGHFSISSLQVYDDEAHTYFHPNADAHFVVGASDQDNRSD